MNIEEQEAFIEEQMKIEEKIIKVATETVKELKNVLVKEMIQGIALDSEKHKMLLTALKAIIKLPTPLIDEKITEEIAKNLEEHIELEAKAIETYKNLLDKLENEKAKLIINAIYRDELRHHELLKKIQKIIVEKETLSEKEFWEYMWEDAFTHGTPGG